MACHVDIMKVDPLVTQEMRLARVILENNRIDIEADNRDYWRGTLVQATGIDPSTHPRDFFEALHPKLDGTYVYATVPHEDDACPLTHGAVANAPGTLH
jgi:hypothetical protein